MADKLRTLQQLESLQAKYVGTGHADTTRYEWSQNIVRDSLASYVGHPPLLAYMALGLGENKEIDEEPALAASMMDIQLLDGFLARVTWSSVTEIEVGISFRRASGQVNPISKDSGQERRYSLGFNDRA
ncbi:hypothetical protein AYO21_01340 [Fonsecaea monophora]|uniref:Splicing factor subunit n=1 Tax=Fonsecaea monophora TaxID=254056 RepID=A0A177FJ72_9EURO|nr:hypothetical protein AYO21_01340 [Fonsecaea monophora]OAG44344.1 hypothetical protein AYO21_01340 [Fonsecaea monophora]